EVFTPFCFAVSDGIPDACASTRAQLCLDILEALDLKPTFLWADLIGWELARSGEKVDPARMPNSSGHPYFKGILTNT
ncbi:hypothetical protein KUCAC02_011157, partial [Chaenocephalus aceratus]